jgi:hypothetical protein
MSAEITLGQHSPVVSHLVQFRIVEIERLRLAWLSKANHAGGGRVCPIDSPEQTGSGTQQDNIERRIEIPYPRFCFR